mmetsp:Transcript_34450/g.45327  ORF Transcript_34450/g.45327 Transcript_34450/m.45327 type:complete len:124 (+) Transcript_34450:686-1057(+)|eukprot:CAMPEP_0185594934 /NCGR_PEP_ID=MMETSP0434-20130131/76661_1 /TAXON_ID=626734 ORGANISM="Favella taraikaensis, Strain Fe Narragansett Bay" /NCGR_SAMPLE_ID=MMETSP0434 /ASSEMBLY_ACC=CAM_ASM_000379 /LENGTH=123 /DNA_ID=CAMNT_0028222591 /DNA_START=685 /DNA_END=1056 /DNA_ORIENTATION=-
MELDALRLAKAEIDAERHALKLANLKTNKHEADDEIVFQNFYQKKRQAEFTMDFSIQSATVQRLTRQMQHWKECEEDLHDPNFKIEQELMNKSLDIVQDEIKTKVALRNYSAMNIPSKRKMEH